MNDYLDVFLLRRGSPDEIADMYGDLRTSSSQFALQSQHKLSQMDSQNELYGRDDNLMYHQHQLNPAGPGGMPQFDDSEDDEDDFNPDSPSLRFHQATYATASMIAKRQDRY